MMLKLDMQFKLILYTWCNTKVYYKMFDPPDNARITLHWKQMQIEC